MSSSWRSCDRRPRRARRVRPGGLLLPRRRRRVQVLRRSFRSGRRRPRMRSRPRARRPRRSSTRSGRTSRSRSRAGGGAVAVARWPAVPEGLDLVYEGRMMQAVLETALTGDFTGTGAGAADASGPDGGPQARRDPEGDGRARRRAGGRERLPDAARRAVLAAPVSRRAVRPHGFRGAVVDRGDGADRRGQPALSGARSGR